MRPALDAAPSGPVFRPFRWVVIPLAILAFFTALSLVTNFDYAAQKAIYIAGGESWDFGTRSLWWFLYEYGTLPAALLCFFAFVGFVLGLFKEKWKLWRPCFLFIILLGATGPGVVSNLILKEHWGRPRPRSVEGLGGSNKFEPVLTIDKTSSGKSFPCGHATMGYFFIGGFFLFRRTHRAWAWFFLISGLCLGFFMGVARMCQGGHFFSDVIWSGAIMYFVALLLYYDLKLYKGLTLPADAKPTPKWMKVGVPILGVAVFAGVLLATPYREVKKYSLVNPAGKTNQLNVRFGFMRGNVTIVSGDEFAINGEAWGHGVPTSKIAGHFVENHQGETTSIFYKERISGHFTEVGQNLTVTLPWDRVISLRIGIDRGEVRIDLPEMPPQGSKIEVSEGKGEVVFQSVPEGFHWNDESDQQTYGLPTDPVHNGSFAIDVLDKFSGKIILNR